MIGSKTPEENNSNGDELTEKPFLEQFWDGCKFIANPKQHPKLISEAGGLITDKNRRETIEKKLVSMNRPTRFLFTVWAYTALVSYSIAESPSFINGIQKPAGTSIRKYRNAHLVDTIHSRSLYVKIEYAETIIPNENIEIEGLKFMLKTLKNEFSELNISIKSACVLIVYKLWEKVSKSIC